MGDASRFRALSAQQRALVATAVLLDGHEAGAFLRLDAENGETLEKAALSLSSLEPELRMPYCGSALRAALKEIK